MVYSSICHMLCNLPRSAALQLHVHTHRFTAGSTVVVTVRFITIGLILLGLTVAVPVRFITVGVVLLEFTVKLTVGSSWCRSWDLQP